jgi:hypothetical protein
MDCGEVRPEYLYDLRRQSQLLASVASFRLDFAGATLRPNHDGSSRLTFSTVPIGCWSQSPWGPDWNVEFTVGANGTPTALHAYGSLLGETLDVKNAPALWGLHFDIEPDGPQKKAPGVNVEGSAVVNGWRIALAGTAYPSRCKP